LAAAVAAAATGVPPVLLSYEDGGSAYSGVGRYEGTTACTAFFLDTGPVAEDAADAPAYAVTSARCARAQGEVVFNFFEDSTGRQVAVPVAAVAYSAPDPADVALLELAAGYSELTSRLIRPLRAPFFSRIAERDPVLVVGVPVWPDPAQAFLRAARCRIEALVPLVSRCGAVLPGNAGAPVLSRLDGTVVAVVGTTATSDTDAVTAWPLAGVGMCFDVFRRFDRRAPDCPLDR
jgi:hypothetical protein